MSLKGSELEGPWQHLTTSFKCGHGQSHKCQSITNSVANGLTRLIHGPSMNGHLTLTIRGPSMDQHPAYPPLSTYLWMPELQWLSGMSPLKTVYSHVVPRHRSPGMFPVFPGMSPLVTHLHSYSPKTQKSWGVHRVSWDVPLVTVYTNVVPSHRSPGISLGLPGMSPY